MTILNCNSKPLSAVSELPVDLFEQSAETETIMRNLGHLPIHIRQAQSWPSHHPPEPDPCPDPDPGPNPCPEPGSECNDVQAVEAPDKLIEVFTTETTANDYSDLNFSVINEQEDQTNEITLASAAVNNMFNAT